MNAVFTVALPVFALILAGVVAARRGFLGNNAPTTLNQFVVYLALPAVLFQAMARIDPAALGNLGYLAAFGGAIAVTMALSLAISRAGGVALANASIQAMGATFANVGFMGIPLCRIAFGEEALVPGVIAMVITACVHFAAAIALIEADLQTHPSAWRTIAKIGRALARNPLLISPIAGLLMGAAGIALPVPLDRFLTLLGAAATPCALVAIGLLIGENRERFEVKLVGRAVVIKLLIQPAIAWLVAFHLVHLPLVWAQTAVLMSALPTGSGAFTLAQLYRREGASTSSAILATTVVSFATVSLLLAWFTG